MRNTEPTSTFGDYVLLRYIEAPQVKSFTLPSLGSHEVRVREHEVRVREHEVRMREHEVTDNNKLTYLSLCSTSLPYGREGKVNSLTLCSYDKGVNNPSGDYVLLR